ncbi:MAG TPA: class I tRNA ligase family protein [Candidatus Paceibacterota bacterium]
MEIEDKLTKPYDPKATEERIYKLWEDSGYFNPDNLPERHKEPFSVMLPPPNVTGVLHLGHALEDSLQDAIVRYKRMRGYKTLWIPGTDHAAIATQSKVEKILEKEGVKRNDIGREEFLKRVEKFAHESHDTIVSQIRRVGASLDWSREAFTLDEERGKAVKEAFARMQKAGLIYRARKVINWDPKGQTTISDDEVVYEERIAKLYTFKYSADFPIRISTTRPETKVGDTAVAVHPDDNRYKAFVGKEFECEFAGVEIHVRIVADISVDPAFGTGALGVTPAHSLIDSEIAERHHLLDPQVIDEHARMTELAGPILAGKKVVEARELVVNWLKEKGLLEKEEEIKQNIATAERTGGIIEPLPKTQWFVSVNTPIAERGNKTLKELMREPVANGEIKILPEHEEKKYYNWIGNLRDWCISRQIWYGHRIPGLETDTLDTWFSSALWSFSTLGWPEKTKDLETYHPNSFINPGYEILFFWLARMIMMSQFLLGEVPFKTAYLHGILRDKQGRKFSKSLGNGVDPIEIIDKSGADALRMSLIVGIAPGMDSNFDEQKVLAYKKFANKIWNVARYVLANSEPNPEVRPRVGPEVEPLIQEFDALVDEITKEMDEYKFYIVAEKVYHYVWHTLADKIIEESKGKPEYGPTLRYLLENSLKLLHPFMPFVTEEIWGIMGYHEQKRLLIIEPWPTNSQV